MNTSDDMDIVIEEDQPLLVEDMKQQKTKKRKRKIKK